MVQFPPSKGMGIFAFTYCIPCLFEYFIWHGWIVSTVSWVASNGSDVCFFLFIGTFIAGLGKVREEKYFPDGRLNHLVPIDDNGFIILALSSPMFIIYCIFDFVGLVSSDLSSIQLISYIFFVIFIIIFLAGMVKIRAVEDYN